MKAKVSVTMDEELLLEADSLILEGRFRSKSHVIEYALKRYLKEEKQ